MNTNAEIAERFEEMADLLEADDVEHKPRAYRRAAENVRGYPAPIEDLAADGEDAVAEIEGVGQALAEKVIEYVETGEIEELVALRERLPVDMDALLRVEGVGPKTIGTLYRELGVQTLDDLERVAENGKIREIRGFGEKTERNILDNVEFARSVGDRQLLGTARPLADAVVAHLDDVAGVGAVEVAGSIRRWRETIGDVDVLAASEDGESVVDALTDWGPVDEVIEAGPIKASVRADGVRVDLQVVVPAEFGSALQYFTGSKEHNVHLRNYAIERGYKVNEYGVFDVGGAGRTAGSATESDAVEAADAGQRAGVRVAGDTEESMYAALGLEWMPPEIREDRGEIEAAERGDLPDLIEEGAVRGDLHVHTEWSDGGYTIEEMVAGAAEFGHDFVCISDHADGPGVVADVGLSDAELRDQMAEIRAVDDQVDVDVLAGVEANVAADGSVGVADDVLADLDCVVASPHSALGMDADGSTARLTTAMEHPSVDVIGHPSGRLLNQREGMELDVRALGEAAAENGVALEVNANPARLDLWGSAIQAALEAGATVAIDTDAHSPGEFEQVRYGVHTARRGWAEPAGVLTARDPAGLRAFLH